MKVFLALILFSFGAFAAEPVGYYNHGSLVDGECLPENGEGYIQLFRDVGHIYGTDEMISMLEKTASELSERYPGKDRLQIEDISSRTGGDIDPHGSHENGLDVDLQFFKADGIEFIPTPSQAYAPEMVRDGRVSSNFDIERNWELVKTLHRHGSVQVIFIDQKLKDALTSYARSRGELTTHQRELNSLRHVENHKDHMHVRLNCPSSAKGCFSKTLRSTGGGQ